MIGLFINIILLIMCLYFLYRTTRVYSLRQEILDRVDTGSERYWDMIRVYERYSYMEMLFSLRTIGSFRREITGDIQDIKKGRKGK